VIQALVMLVAGFYVVINLVVDLLYAVFDPRIRTPDVGHRAVHRTRPAAPPLARYSTFAVSNRSARSASRHRGDDVRGIFASMWLPITRRHRLLRHPGGAIVDHWAPDAFGRDTFRASSMAHAPALVIGFTSSLLGSSIGAILALRRRISGQDRRLDSALRRYSARLPIIVLALVVVAALRKFVIGAST